MGAKILNTTKKLKEKNPKTNKGGKIWFIIKIKQHSYAFPDV